jgi:hypothetical protein
MLSLQVYDGCLLYGFQRLHIFGPRRGGRQEQADHTAQYRQQVPEYWRQPPGAATDKLCNNRDHFFTKINQLAYILWAIQ